MPIVCIALRCCPCLEATASAETLRKLPQETAPETLCWRTGWSLRRRHARPCCPTLPKPPLHLPKMGASQCNLKPAPPACPRRLEPGHQLSSIASQCMSQLPPQQDTHQAVFASAPVALQCALDQALGLRQLKSSGAWCARMSRGMYLLQAAEHDCRIVPTKRVCVAESR